jgi:hypothetical protein
MHQLWEAFDKQWEVWFLLWLLWHRCGVICAPLLSISHHPPHTVTLSTDAVQMFKSQIEREGEVARGQVLSNPGKRKRYNDDREVVPDSDTEQSQE